MKKQHIYGILVVIWMSLIFSMSAQVAHESQAMSDSLLDVILAFFHITFLQQENFKDMISFLIRKAAHMSEYAILAILVYKYFASRKMRHVYSYAFIISVLYACSDEIHQLFVSGRSGEMMDVGIDSCGAFIGLSLLSIVMHIMNKRRSRHGIE